MEQNNEKSNNKEVIGNNISDRLYLLGIGGLVIVCHNNKGQSDVIIE